MSAGAELHLQIRPVDTLMFRDGRPFNQGDPGAAEAASVFPPFPPTVVGMVRALLAREMKRRFPEIGWDERSDWSKCAKLVDALGSGVDWREKCALGPLTFAPAVICQGGTPLYAVPRSILAAGSAYARLAPAPASLVCDLGEVRLPTPPQGAGDGVKEVARKWITSAGLQAVLGGDVPAEADLVDEDDLWRREPRVGVGIDMGGVGSDGAPISKLAERRPVDGALYAATHTRLEAGVSLAVTVRTSRAEGLSLQGPQLGAAGGEHRMAEIAPVEPRHAPKVPEAPQRLKSDGGKVRYVVYHASPCLLASLPQAGAPLDPAWPGTVVSACLGKAQPIGGWDSQGRRPIPMRPAIPAGSVWFIEAPAQEEARILGLHGASIGEAWAWGFGHIFIGTW
jgi:CRISPR-associated protein Cmr3